MVSSTEFVPHIEKLFDESVLIGSGWTTYESLRYDVHINSSFVIIIVFSSLYGPSVIIFRKGIQPVKN